MIQTIKKAWAVPELRKKIVFTLLILLIFRIGNAIPTPYVNTALLEEYIASTGGSLFSLYNAMSGGAFESASIFALGVMPYISASIIIQLLSMDIVPYLSELSKQGGVGRNKLNQITRVVGIILAFVQGYMYSFSYIKNGNAMDYMVYSLVLTAGTALVLWTKTARKRLQKDCNR